MSMSVMRTLAQPWTAMVSTDSLTRKGAMQLHAQMHFANLSQYLAKGIRIAFLSAKQEFKVGLWLWGS
jgi:hypothetical protein